MQVTNRRTGEVVQLPDEYDDDQIINHFAGQQATPLAQSFIGSAQQNVGPQLAQTLAQGPQRSTLPNIGGGAMVGLTPQQAQFTLQSAQQSNVDSMEQRMRQQQQVQNSIEAEKDRNQTLKLRQQELKNLVQAKKLEAEADKFEAELRAQDRTLDRETRLQVESMRQEAAAMREQNRTSTLAPGAILTDAQGNQIASNPKPPEAPPEPKWQLDTIQMRNSDTGELEDVRAWVAPGQPPQVVGPAPIRQQSQQSLTPRDRIGAINDMVSTMARDQANAGLGPDNPGYMTMQQMIQHATQFVDQMVSGTSVINEQPTPGIIGGPTPEQQEEMRIMRQSGVQVAFDPSTGEVVYVGGR